MKQCRIATTRTAPVLRAALTSLLLSCSSHALAQPNPYSQTFTAFESGQVRPLAITPDKKYLLSVNTPDAKLEIFKIKSDGLEHRVSLPVGMEPVPIAVRNNEEAWVVNHLSDSVSIVSLDDRDSRVKRTLLVGDEPRDIVFAGHNRSRAFITTAHRGQNSPVDPQLTTPGAGRADVWVFDAEKLGDALGGEPLSIVTLFSDTPRALAVSPDGSRVYAAAFHSGNRTTTVNALTFLDQLERKPGPTANFQGITAPVTGLVVRFDGEHWRDEEGGQ